MMKLLIMHHAEALSKQAARAKFDADRPLSAVGRDQAARVGRALVGIDVLPTRIVCSPFVRTQESAAIVNEQLPKAVSMLPLTVLAPGSGTDELLRAVLNYADPTRHWVLAVLHEPDVSLILGNWLGEGSGKCPFEVAVGDLFAMRVNISHGKSYGKLAYYYSPGGIARD